MDFMLPLSRNVMLLKNKLWWLVEKRTYIKVLEELNCTFIILIPKNASLESIIEF